MSEVNLAALAESAAEIRDKKTETPMQEINEVLKTCSIGLFHVRLLATSLFGFISGILISNTAAYILPIAECDLHMNLVQKGILNAMPYIGMLISSIVAGFLTDTFGRKLFLIGGNAGIFLFTIFSAMSQTYEMLLVGKFFEGLLFAVAFSPMVTFTSEYCHNGIRDRVMLLQSSYQAFGQIVLAGLSWVILTNNWRVVLFDGRIVLNTWNFYLLITSIFSLVTCLLYSMLPESPKYLITQNKYEEARATLIKVYTQNTRKPADTFPYPDLWKNQVKSLPIDETPEDKQKESFAKMLVVGLHNSKVILQRPLGPKLLLLSTLLFLVMALYNIIRLWFPQLSTIVEHYKEHEKQDLCDMLDSYTRDQKIKFNTTIEEECVPTRSGTQTYINSVVMGVICVLPFIISGALVNRVGKKLLLLIAGCITIGCTISLRWASTKTEIVALFAADMAICQTMMSLIQTITIDVFPTNVRTLAISVIMMAGRIGSLGGNVAFPILLDIGCVIPFFTLAGVMICVTFMMLLLPNKNASKK